GVTCRHDVRAHRRFDRVSVVAPAELPPPCERPRPPRRPGSLESHPPTCGRERARPANGSFHVSVERSEVIVLDQYCRREIEAVVHAPTAPYRILLQPAPARRGLARVQDLGTRSLHRLNELVRASCNARQALQEVERNTFRRKHRT